MVDAVDAVNAATQTIIQQKKTVSIDWRHLTANQILEYAGQGEDVPADILRWAQDYSKLVNAPEDVSYDSVNGASNSDEVDQNDASTSNVSAYDSADKNAQENDSIDDKENPEVLYNQAGVLIGESKTSTDIAIGMTRSAETKAEQSTEIAALATTKADTAEDNAKTTRAEYDELLSKLQSDKSAITPADLVKLDKLAEQLTSIGNTAQSQLSILDIQLQEIEAVFSQYEEIPMATTVKGSETVDIGAQLVADSPENQNEIKSAATENAGKGAAQEAMKKVHMARWKFIFDRNFIRGQEAITVGGNTLDAGENSKKVLTDSIATNNESITNTRNAIDRVEDITLVDGKTIDLGENNSKADTGETEATNEKKVNKNSAINQTDLNGVKDSTLLTDALELHRRKENRGENIQQT